MAEDEESTKFRVLIVDDSPEIVSRITELISSFLEFVVLEPISRGDDAIEKIQELAPDLAIVDMNLPGISGINVVREIRKFNKKSRIVVLTMFERSDYESSCLEAGADFFLNKIDDFDTLSDILQSLTEEKK